MLFPYFDPIYLLFMLPGLLLGSIAFILLNYWTNKYSKEIIINNITGNNIIKTISQKYNLKVGIDLENNMLSSGFDPKRNTINISNDIIHMSTISGTAILAHEMGHVIQHQKGSILANLRLFVIPAVNIGTNLGYFLIIVGLIIQFSTLSWLGLGFFSLATVLILITLPLEIGASIMANKMLRETQICFPKEMPKINKVLTAAALTYAAALFQSLVQLAYFFFRLKRRTIQ